MQKFKKISCGILLYRQTPDLEIFLAKPGGPFGKNGKYGIPKGKFENFDKNYKSAAIREFNEETGANIDFDINELKYLGSVIQNKNKTVMCYFYKYDLGDSFVTKSNIVNFEYPKRSGVFIEIPEIEDGKYFKINNDLKLQMIDAQFSFVKMLCEILKLQEPLLHEN